MVFYSYGTGNSNIPDITAGQTCRVIITRNATTKATTAYFNGAQRSQVTDTNDFYVASTAGGILHFFRDNGTENSSGFVDQIRIYNQVLMPAQAAALGDAAGVPPNPEISLSGNATAIPDGDLLPSTAKHTRFGSVENSLARTFTIQNTGTSSLAISSIVVSGESASEFAVSGAPTSVASGTSVPFTVIYTPVSGVATSRATVTVNNNDSSEAAYDFVVEGEKVFPTIGTNWAEQTPAAANNWNSVAYGNGRFVAVASDGPNRVMTSPDGSTWTPRNATEVVSWASVAYGNGVFVAISSNGTNRVMTSSASNAAAALSNWTASQGITGSNALPNATPFGDGVANLLKYAFNMPLDGPRSNALNSIVGPGANGLPVFTVSPTGPNPTLTAKFLRRRNSGLNYVPQLGTSLGNFTPMTGQETVTPIDAEWELVPVVAPLGTPTPSTAFSRVSVSLPRSGDRNGRLVWLKHPGSRLVAEMHCRPTRVVRQHDQFLREGYPRPLQRAFPT